MSCSFSPYQSVDFSWEDILSVQHNEHYVGSLGLAPEWSTEPLSDRGQRWVSACLAARTNFFALPVQVSLRGDVGALSTDFLERLAFPHLEGGFWGNLFTQPPTLSACYYAPEYLHSVALHRVCATGFLDGLFTQSCGVIQRVGTCATACTDKAATSTGYAQCGGHTEVVTAFLN